MSHMQAKMDALKEENLSLKRELDLLKVNQKSARDELQRTRELAANQSANSGTAESRLRVA